MLKCILKIISKTRFTSIIVLFLFNPLKAQKRISIAPELGISVPIDGISKSFYQSAYNFHFQIEALSKNQRWALLARSGLDVFPSFLNMQDFSEYFQTNTILELPFYLGSRYYILKGFYIDLELGIMIPLSNKVYALVYTPNSPNNPYLVNEFNSTTQLGGPPFGFTGSLGYNFNGFSPFIRVTSPFQNYGAFNGGGNFLTFGVRYKLKL